MAECAYYLELMSQSLDGQLNQTNQARLQEHLEHCPDCRVVYGQLREIHDELSSWQEQEVPEGFAQGVMERIREAESPAQKVIPLWKHPRIRALGSVAACAALCLGLWRGHSSAPQGDPVSDPQTKYTVSQAAPQVANAAGSYLQQERSPEELLLTITRLTGSSPGTVLVVEEIPGELDGTWYRSGEELTFLVVDSDQPQALLQQLTSSAQHCLHGDGDALVLVLCS